MQFEELQKNIGNTMNPLFVTEQKKLFDKIKLVEDEIQVVFSFKGSYKVEENPAEWLVIQYFNKLNNILVSLQNMVLLNDEFFSYLALKYIYEFYIKLRYISCTESDELFNERVKNYITLGRKVRIEKIVKELEGQDELLKKIKESHASTYRLMNSIAHPNVESLNLHKVTRSPEDRFEGLRMNMQFCMYLIYGLIEVATTDERFKLVVKPDLKRLKLLTDDINNF